MLGVCYYPEHWPEAWWAEDARRMVEMGISHVRLGEFAWSKLEPASGQFDWGWLDRAMDTLHQAGLRIVLGTPTATPPKWLVEAYPALIPTDIEGRPRNFGSRRHYSFSSPDYWRESKRIVEIIAKRYGAHPGLVGWQTDNEYGCHFTVLSWGADDLAAFQNWLRQQYQSPDQLNEAWGNVFWSMEVASFAAVTLPHLTVTEANPAARLDFWRFQSSQVAAYNKMQTEIIRSHSPGRFVTHNYMGFFTEFDHWALRDDLDFASWDSYPLGFTDQFFFSPEEKLAWATTGHPDIAGFHHDLYRGVGKGRFWVMEQQPGPVNWAAWNPIPKPGMVRLWGWEALAHGAEVVSYFRWRQAPFAQEQMHAGLNLAQAHELSSGGKEVERLGQELKTVALSPAKNSRAEVALVFDYESAWISHIQPQGKDFSYEELAFRWYEAARSLGQSLDICGPGDDLSAYKLVLVPSLLHVSPQALAALQKKGPVMVFGPRSGSKTRHFAIPPNLAPGPLSELLGLRVLEVASLRPGVFENLKSHGGRAERWCEHIETSAKVLDYYANGWPAWVCCNEKNHYIAGWPDASWLRRIMSHVLQQTGLVPRPLPPGIRLRQSGAYTFAINYGDEPWPAEMAGELLIGQNPVAPQDISIWKTHDG